MNKPLVLLCVAGAFASGCVAYDPQYTESGAYQSSNDPRYSSYPDNRTRYYNTDGTYYYRDGDRDRDGVPNSQDRRPNNPNRY
jgi:hypothetical protein